MYSDIRSVEFNNMNIFRYSFDQFKRYKYIRIFIQLILHPMNIFGYSFVGKNNIRYTLCNLSHLDHMQHSNTSGCSAGSFLHAAALLLCQFADINHISHIGILNLIQGIPKKCCIRNIRHYLYLFV